MRNFKSQKILLVDDDAQVLSALALFLDCLDLTYLTATNGLEAIELLKLQKIDVLVTDFQMPTVDGVELLNWCRENKLHFPVIFTSATLQHRPHSSLLRLREAS